MNRRYSYPGAPVFYVSPLKRCVETCKIIYPQVTPILVPALSECNFGEWEGKTAEELKDCLLYTSTAGGYGNKKASSALPLDFSTKGRKAPPLRKRKELFPKLSGSIFRKEEGEYP